MITNITKENEGATITIPKNTPIVPPLNSVVIQQGQIQTQTQVQEYEQKNTMSRKVINETTLRIYVPRNPDADQTFQINPMTSPAHLQTGSTMLPGPFHSDSLHSMDEAFAT